MTVESFITDWTLVALIPVVLLGALVGWVSEELYLGLSASFLILGYIAVKSQNSALMGAFLLLLMFMAMKTAVYMAKAILGDTR